MGLPLPILCLLSPAWALPAKAALNQLPGKYQSQPESNPRGLLEEKEKEERLAPA